MSLSCLSLTFASMTLMGRSIVWLYVFFALLPIASLGTMQVTWTHLVMLWFERNRGLALALMLSGTGTGSGVHPVGGDLGRAALGLAGGVCACLRRCRSCSCCLSRCAG